MPIGKYDRFVPKDFSWSTAITKLPEFDAASFDSILSQNQQELEQVSLLSEKAPRVLQTQDDLNLYNAYKSDMEKGLEDVSKAYIQGIGSGQLAYKQYLNKVRNDWGPTGRASALQSRYDSYQKALQDTENFYRDDTSPVNKTLAKQQLQEQLKNPIKFDPQTGTYTSISTPELYKNPDINKAIDGMLKEIEANGDTQFLGDMNKDWWIQKIKTESRPAERIKLAYQALASQPEYASQIDRDTQYKALQTDPVKYQEQYVAKQNNALDQLTQANEKAKTDPNAAKELQSLLRQEGYNISVDGQYGAQTQKAAEEYLNQKKQDVQDNINGFDLNRQLRNDVNQSYQGYATRGAYEKRDIDLVFNQAKKAASDIALKSQENKINRDRLNYEFAAKDQSQITVVDGIAQQLPEIQKYYQDSKLNRDNYKAKIDQSLKNSKTFNGWKLEDVAQAYQKWEGVTGNTEAEKIANFKALLNQGSGFQFTDDQVKSLYQEMNAPNTESALKTSLETYGQAQAEVDRLEEGQTQIASQYINTPEGQKAVQALRSSITDPSLKQLSDKDLSARAISNPELFERELKTPVAPGSYSFGKSVPWNPAKDFSRDMVSDIKVNKSKTNYDWGTLGTDEIYTGSKDMVLKPTLDAIGHAIETGSGANFSTFGEMGLKFKDNKGNDLTDGEAKKVTTVVPAKDMKGNPILKVGVTVTKADGKTKDGYTEIALAPDSRISREVLSGAKNAYIAKINAGENIPAQGILDFIDAVQGRNGVKQAAIDVQVKSLDLNNTTDEPILIRNLITGELVPVTSLGWKSRDLNDDASIGGFEYKTYGFNTPSGNVVGNVVVDPSTGYKMLVPSQDGSTTYSSSSGIAKDRLGKQLLSETPVIVTKTKE